MNDVTYNSCTRIRNYHTNSDAWCSVSVDNSGKHVEGEGDWGICEPACQSDRCLTDGNKCIGTRILDGQIKSNETYDMIFEARTEAPCIFPFKDGDDTLHYACRKSNDKDFYCATSVDQNKEMETHGWCNESCPSPNEDTTTQR